MRQLYHFDNSTLAQTFSDFLYTQGIENQLQEDEGQFVLWIYSDDEMDRAQKLLHEFQNQPHDARYLAAKPLASSQRSESEKQEKLSRIIDVRTQLFGKSGSMGWLTLSLISICIVVAVVSHLGKNTEYISRLFITNYYVSDGFIEWRAGLPEVMQGQVWRLLTPIFIHFGFLHLLFNMMWLKDLGGMLEKHESVWLLLLQVVIIGSLANLAQYFWSGPSFGGMSGVVYGLLGYIWIRGKFDPYAKLTLNPSVVMMMIFWFFLCMTGLMGAIANTAHGVGLGVGMLWGFIAAQYNRYRMR